MTDAKKNVDEVNYICLIVKRRRCGLTLKEYSQLAKIEKHIKRRRERIEREKALGIYNPSVFEQGSIFDHLDEII